MKRQGPTPGPTWGCPYCAVGMHKAADSAIGLPRRSTNAWWMLAFLTPAECVDRVATLFTETERRAKMKVANFTYYHQFLRPDRLVLNSLLLAMDGASAHSPTPSA